MTDWAESEPVRCAVCNKEVGGFTHCCRCGYNTCGSDDCYTSACTIYKCDGYHYFYEDACERCRDKVLSKVVNDKYYCPRCAPPDGSDEYNLKVFVVEQEERLHRVYFDIIRTGCSSGYAHGPGVSEAFLNDPAVWTRFRENPAAVQAEIEKLILGEGNTMKQSILNTVAKRGGWSSIPASRTAFDFWAEHVAAIPMGQVASIEANRCKKHIILTTHSDPKDMRLAIDKCNDVFAWRIKVRYVPMSSQ